MQHATRPIHFNAFAVIVGAVAATFAATAALAIPPSAPSQPVTETMHGVSVADP